jgi:hypothetical protein
MKGGIVAELEMDEVRAIWKNQPTAPRARSRQEILEKARSFETGNRLRLGLFWGLGVLFLILGFNDRDPWAAFAKFVVACVLVVAYEKAYGLRSKLNFMTLGLEAASSTGIAFYRSELLRRREFFKRPHRRVLLPLLFLITESLRFIGVSMRSGQIINLIPIIAILSVWLLFTLRRKRRELPVIEREIEALDRLVESFR